MRVTGVILTAHFLTSTQTKLGRTKWFYTHMPVIVQTGSIGFGILRADILSLQVDTF